MWRLREQTSVGPRNAYTNYQAGTCSMEEIQLRKYLHIIQISFGFLTGSWDRSVLTDQHSTNDNHSPIVCESHPEHHNSPREYKCIQERFGPDPSKRQSAGNLKQEICDEEDQQSNRVAIANVETEICVHAGNSCVG